MRHTLSVFALILAPLTAFAQELPQTAYCGDGILQPGEECDDGNDIDSDGCTRSCLLTKDAPAAPSAPTPGAPAGSSVFTQETPVGNSTFNQETPAGNNSLNGMPSESSAGMPFHTMPVRPKDPGLALGLSLGGTAVGHLLFLTTVVLSNRSGNDAALFITVPMAVIGPSLGHFYTGHVGRGLLMSGLRLTAPPLMGALLISATLNSLFGKEGAAENDVLLFSLLGAGYLGLVLIDVIDAPQSAKRFNERQLSIYSETIGLPRKPKPSISLLPTPLRAPDGSAGLGLSLSGSF